jgi:hypothetical protein
MTEFIISGHSDREFDASAVSRAPPTALHSALWPTQRRRKERARRDRDGSALALNGRVTPHRTLKVVPHNP